MAVKKSKKKKEVLAEEVVTPTEVPLVPTGLSFAIEGPVYPDGCMHFSSNDLLRYELLQERVQSSLQSIGLNMAEKERVANMANKEIERIRKEANEKIAEVDGARVNLVSTGKTREEELRKFQIGLGVAYNGLDIQRISYDSMSGKIFVIEDGESRPIPSPTQ